MKPAKMEQIQSKLLQMDPADPIQLSKLNLELALHGFVPAALCRQNRIVSLEIGSKHAK